MNKKKIANLAPYGYITPITVILIGFVIVSVIISIVLSFTRYNIMTPPTFYGLKNYERLVTDTKFMKALFNTLKLMVMIVPLQMILSLIVSVFLVSHRHMLIGKIANSVIFIPVLCSNAATGVIWRELLNGKIPAVETFFGLFGIKASMLLGNAKTALAVVAAVAIWKMLGYYVVIYSSGLLGISESFYEAAKVDGASTWKTYWSIVFPIMKPMHATVAVLTAMSTWNDVMTPLVIMSGTGKNTLPLAQLNFQTQFGTNYNLAFASYLLALLPILIFYLICQKQIINGVVNGAVK